MRSFDFSILCEIRNRHSSVYEGKESRREYLSYLSQTTADVRSPNQNRNEDGKTVRAMDVLFPKIGEIIGGSEREADYDKLLNRINEMGIPMKDSQSGLPDV